jgi:hypothetical protein
MFPWLLQKTTPNPAAPGLPLEVPSKFNLINPEGGGDQVRRDSFGLGALGVLVKRGIEGEVPTVQDALFMWRTFQVLIFPRLQMDGFSDVVMNLIPNMFPILMSCEEDTHVPLFPKFPKDKPEN